jgi:hypothetical protein
VKELTQLKFLPTVKIFILSFFIFSLLSACQPGQLLGPQKIVPEKAFVATIQDLNQATSEKNISKIYPDGVKIKAYVVSYYKGGPVDKEIIGLAAQKPQLLKTDYSEVQPSVFCARETSPADTTVKVGDEVTVAGFLYRSSAQDNIFLQECQVLP